MSGQFASLKNSIGCSNNFLNIDVTTCWKSVINIP